MMFLIAALVLPAAPQMPQPTYDPTIGQRQVLQDRSLQRCRHLDRQCWVSPSGDVTMEPRP